MKLQLDCDFASTQCSTVELAATHGELMDDLWKTFHTVRTSQLTDTQTHVNARRKKHTTVFLCLTTSRF